MLPAGSKVTDHHFSHTHESLTSNLLSGTEQLSARWLLASTQVCIYLVKHIFHLMMRSQPLTSSSQFRLDSIQEMN